MTSRHWTLVFTCCFASFIACDSDPTSVPANPAPLDVHSPQHDTRDETTPPSALEPEPEILADEGPDIEPQTVIYLQGEAHACDEGPTSWLWEVNQPPGSRSSFEPSDQVANPAFVANVAGEYLFTLQRANEDGESCAPPKIYAVTATPTTTLHIELLWSTASDPDEYDDGPGAGTDLDLHFRRQDPESEGDDPFDGWFDQPFDCFWFNPQPNWGDLNPLVDDDPSLDLDDTDGAGPENLNFQEPEEGIQYPVLVHHWSDAGFGPADATVLVYVEGSLVYESEPVTLAASSAWYVGVLDGSTLEFTPAGDVSGGPVTVSPLESPMM